MALTITLFAAAFLMSVMVVPLLQRRVDRRRLLVVSDYDSPEPATTTRISTADANVPPSYQRTALVDAVPVILPPVIGRDRAALFTTIPPEVRGHTAIGAKPGDGKTQTSIALMVQDIARGAQVYWLNPQYTYYHPDDQPTDLTPIKHLFTVVEDYARILATLQAAHVLGEQRKPLYRAGQNVGHNIVLYLDEWPAIYAELGDPVAEILQRILRECRKLNIWIVLCAQDFLVATTGFSSGVRAAFNTKLVGNVDITTWNTLLGGSIPKQPIAKGTWMTEDGLAEVVRPSDLLIGNMARLSPRRYDPLVSTVSTDDTLIESLILQRVCAEVDAETTETTRPKPFQAPETPVSPVGMAKNEDDDPFRNVDFMPLARLVKANLVTETNCLKVAFGVKPGESAAYKSARAGLKKALQNLEEISNDRSNT